MSATALRGDPAGASLGELQRAMHSLGSISETLLSSYRELTERAAELEERVHGLDRLASLGNMAAGIAHEVRNPLHGVQGFASLLLRSPALGERERAWARRIVEGAEEANAILTSMLSLARPGGLHLETVRGEELLAEAVERALPGGSGDGRWTVETACGAPPFAADRIKLRQAARNLIANALQVQPAGGRARVALELRDGQIELCVDDAGPGVAPELRRRVFEPFFTTRAEGSGLGLALVWTIARLHGGGVELDAGPSPLGGARLSIRIPFRDPAAAPADALPLSR